VTAGSVLRHRHVSSALAIVFLVACGGETGTKPVRTITMAETGAPIEGRIPPADIRRVIRASFRRFRACYQQGLAKDPGVEGTVSVKFIIDLNGAVESVSLAGGSLTDPQVTNCIVEVYRSLIFPKPEDGKVMVTYPLDFRNND
jgi:TonB family protein